MDNIEKRRTTVLSAAAGLACRLLEARACRLLAQNKLLGGTADGDLVEIVVSSGKSTGQVHYGNAAGGGDLAFGDVLARRRLNKATGQCSDSPSVSLLGDKSFTFLRCWWMLMIMQQYLWTRFSVLEVKHQRRS